MLTYLLGLLGLLGLFDRAVRATYRAIEVTSDIKVVYQGYTRDIKVVRLTPSSCESSDYKGYEGFYTSS